jgi:long-chain acyl-CoA synthetase
LIDLLRRSSDTHPSKTALVAGTEQVAYRELLSLTGQLVTGLHSAGIRPGNPVVILLRNSLEFVVSFYAVTGLGAAAVLLDPHSREHELAHACRDCQPRAIITDTEGLARWQQATEDVFPSGFELVVGGANAGEPEFWHFVEEHREATRWESNSDRVATYQYSSGSTGRAKRIGRTHAQWSFEAASFAAAAGHRTDDVVLCVVPLFHAYGCGSCLLTAAQVGATLVLQEHVQPFALRRIETLELARRWSATVFPGVPYMFELLAGAPDRDALPSLRYCGSSGAALTEATFRAFDARFGIPIRQDYGSTEAGKIAVNTDADPRPTWASVGKALPGIELVTLDDSGQRRSAGEVGKVAIRSPGLTTDHPSESPRDSPFVADFFLTGDLGQLDEEGRLTIVGRTKLFIDVLGEKVDPAEVEEVLVLHPSVRESVVVGIPGERSGDTILKAVVVPDGPCDERELTRFCKERLSSFKVPSVIELRESLPRSQIGKILRKDLLG